MVERADERDFERRLAARDLFELALDLLLIEQLAARELVDLAAQIGDAILVGVLHLRLAREQAGQHVVAEREIGGGNGRPSGHHDQRADDGPERHRSDADLPSAVTQGPAGLRRRMISERRSGAPEAMGMAVVEQHFEQRTDVTSTLPPGPKQIGPVHEFRFDPHMVNFPRKRAIADAGLTHC